MMRIVREIHKGCVLSLIFWGARPLLLKYWGGQWPPGSYSTALWLKYFNMYTPVPCMMHRWFYIHTVSWTNPMFIIMTLHYLILCHRPTYTNVGHIFLSYLGNSLPGDHYCLIWYQTSFHNNDYMQIG